MSNLLEETEVTDETYQEFVFDALRLFFEELETRDKENMPRAWRQGGSFSRYGGIDIEEVREMPFRIHRQLLKDLLTVHRFDPSEKVHATMDKLLAYELKHTKVTNWEDLENLNFLPGMEGCRVSIWKGDICTIKIGAIVNAANCAMLGCFSPNHPCIDNAIHDKAGPRLRADCREMMRKQGTLEETGIAKITPAYCLPSDYVLHTVGPIYPETGERPDLLGSCYVECMKLCKEKNVRSVAFCCISTGMFGYPQRPATQVALSSVKEFLEADENWKCFDSVVFNVFRDDDLELYQEYISDYFGTKPTGTEVEQGEVTENKVEESETGKENEDREQCSCCKAESETQA
eukprot:TRINITY_DN13109_c0_g1_i1.p1 TRINITY_DN13109_c0_g1~~TRINITY_DN13109_c0_g1_i1.p1  ORF type:complete len:347 (-),score=76.89 TRINITY_DN13109_c0_g1_i1:1-1041(-)